MFSKVFKKYVTYLALFTLVYPIFHPLALYAQLQEDDLYDQSTLNEYSTQGWEPYNPSEMVDWINEGRELFNTAPSPAFNTNSGQLQPIDHDGTPLLNEDGTATTVESTDLGDDGAMGDTTLDSDNYGDNNAMILRGTGERTRLYNTGDFNTDPDAPADAQAYRLMRHGFSAPTPDIENDPVLTGSDYVMSAQGQADFDEHYGRGCETNPALVTTTPRALAVPDIRQCTRTVQPAQSCTAQHNVTFTTPIVDVVFFIDGTGGTWESHSEKAVFASINILEDIVPLDEFDVAVGVGFYGHPNSDSINHQTPPILMPTQDQVELGNFLVSAASLLSGQSSVSFGDGDPEPVDDPVANFYHTYHTYRHYYDNVYTPRPGAETVYVLVHGNRPFATSEIIIQFQPPGLGGPIGNSSIYPFTSTNFIGLGTPPDHLYVSTPNESHISFTPTEFMAYPLEGPQILDLIGQFAEVETDQWVSDGNCLALLESANTANCEINFTSILPEFNPKCSLLDDHHVCDDTLMYDNLSQFPYSIDGVNRLNTSFTALYSCSGFNSTCQAYEDDPQCSFAGSTPVGAPDALGNFSQHEEEWDCGVPVAAPTLVSPQGYSNCGNAPTRCALGECTDPAREGSVAFGQVAAAATAIDMAAFDSACDVTQPETCMVFAGQDFNCHEVGEGLLLDCCDIPVDATLTEFLAGFALMRQIDSAYGSPIGSFVSGGWSTVTQAVSGAGSSIYSAIGKPFASAAESLTANWQGVMTDGLLDGFRQRILEYTAQTITDLFGQGAAEALFSYAADGTVEGLGGTVLGPAISALGVLMTAYLYYQVAVLIVGLIDECDDDVGELAQKRELKSCVYIGKDCPPTLLGGCATREDKAYCCYNSPLSRIVQEAAKQQFGTTFGDYDDPNCEGLTFEELATIDWEQIDWMEWEAIMVEADALPIPADMNINVLTGNESPLQAGEPFITPTTQTQRLNTAERNIERYNNLSLTATEDEINRGAEEGAYPTAITTQ